MNSPFLLGARPEWDQESRDRALASFKSGSSRVLIATDVAARGLDVKTIRLVVSWTVWLQCS